MSKVKILFIGGSLNQTTMMHQISKNFPDCECWFTPFYCDGILEFFRKKGLLNFTVLGGKFREATENYLVNNYLQIDYRGNGNDYDLVFTCSDLVVPRNIRNKKLVLVQEGMTDPENVLYFIVKWFGLPRYLAGTSTNGLSDQYDKFCVASEGYRDLFIRKGCRPGKIEITGIPNYDNLKKFLKNDFPYKGFVLAATSDSRETFKYENRKKFIRDAVSIANGRQIIFKLHPNEKFERAISEIEKHAPGALIYTEGNINEMIANCDVLITRFSTVVYTGIALGKEVYSYFDKEELIKQMPLQNNGKSAFNVAIVGRELLEQYEETLSIGMKYQNA